MVKKIYTEEYIKNIANAIRYKLDDSSIRMTLSEMPDLIKKIEADVDILDNTKIECNPFYDEFNKVHLVFRLVAVPDKETKTDPIINVHHTLENAELLIKLSPDEGDRVITNKHGEGTTITTSTICSQVEATFKGSSYYKPSKLIYPINNTIIFKGTSITLYAFIESKGAIYLNLDGNIKEYVGGRVTYEDLEDKTHTLIIQGNVIALPNSGFNSSSISEMIVPIFTSRIGNSCFAHSKELEKVVIQNDDCELGTSVFMNCGKLTEIVLPNNLDVLKNDLFFKCRELTKVNIPHNLKSISDNCFAECNRLSSVDLPSTLQEIGSNAFYNCSSLENIIFNSLIPPLVVEGAFNGVKEGCKAHVPAGAKTDYESVLSTYNITVVEYGNEV